MRFVQIYCGGGSQWDAHSDLEGNHTQMCGRCDQPTAALIRDLKRRGLLDRTLVIWGGEFGRTPMTEGGNGRDHNPYGFTMWLAGGGVKGGQIIGRDRRIGIACGRESHSRPRSARDDAATAGLRAYEADVLAQRPRGTIDRELRARGEGACWLVECRGCGSEAPISGTAVSLPLGPLAQVDQVEKRRKIPRKVPLGPLEPFWKLIFRFTELSWARESLVMR